jgi:glycosyltransferase involved in cell wall biosynthesis
MSNKKVLHVTANMNPVFGGVSEALRTIIASLSGDEITNEVVSLDPPNAPYNEANLFESHCLGPGKGPWQYSRKLVPWLLQNVSRYDVVIIHGLWLFHGYAVRRVLNQLRDNQVNAAEGKPLPKVFIVPHGMLDPYFQLARGRKLKAIRNLFYWKWVESRIVNEADAILFTAEQEKQLARSTFTPYFPKDERVVGMSILEPPTYTSAMSDAFLEKCPASNGQQYFLFLSRLHEKKGLELLIRAYSEILSGRPNDMQLPKLVIAGPGLDTQFGKKMLQMAEEFHSHIYFTGMLSGDSKWGAFYGCDAFVLPTHQENFGIAIVEALACGKPVLISDKTNIWKEIKDSGGGLVEDDTLSGTKKLLSRWLNLTAIEKEGFKQKSLEAYKNYFSIDSVKKKWSSSIRDSEKYYLK